MGEVDVVMVDKKYRRMGVSRLLLKEMTKWFKKNRMQFVELTVSVRNDVGIKAWKKHGFRGKAFVMQMKLI